MINFKDFSKFVQISTKCERLANQKRKQTLELFWK